MRHRPLFPQSTSTSSLPQESLSRQNKPGIVAELLRSRIESLASGQERAEAALEVMIATEARHGAIAGKWSEKYDWMKSVVESNHQVNTATWKQTQNEEAGVIKLQEPVTPAALHNYVQELVEPEAGLDVGVHVNLGAENEAMLTQARQALDSIRTAEDFNQAVITSRGAQSSDAMRYELPINDVMADRL